MDLYFGNSSFFSSQSNVEDVIRDEKLLMNFLQRPSISQQQQHHGQNRKKSSSSLQPIVAGNLINEQSNLQKYSNDSQNIAKDLQDQLTLNSNRKEQLKKQREKFQTDTYNYPISKSYRILGPRLKQQTTSSSQSILKTHQTLEISKTHSQADFNLDRIKLAESVLQQKTEIIKEKPVHIKDQELRMYQEQFAESELEQDRLKSIIEEQLSIIQTQNATLNMVNFESVQNPPSVEAKKFDFDEQSSGIVEMCFQMYKNLQFRLQIVNNLAAEFERVKRDDKVMEQDLRLLRKMVQDLGENMLSVISNEFDSNFLYRQMHKSSLSYNSLELNHTKLVGRSQDQAQTIAFLKQREQVNLDNINNLSKGNRKLDEKTKGQAQQIQELEQRVEVLQNSNPNQDPDQYQQMMDSLLNENQFLKRSIFHLQREIDKLTNSNFLLKDKIERLTRKLFQNQKIDNIASVALQEGQEDYQKLLFRVKPPGNLNDLITFQTSQQLSDLVLDIANGQVK